jgi:aspartate kinase
LGAEKVEFYKDVPGIFSEDPKINPAAEFYPVLDYDKALEIIRKGAKVLQSRCIELAAKNGVLLHVLPFSQTKGSSGTLICGLAKERAPAVYEKG